ncbi:MAG: carboxypeptidase-like regulatory domain-containing protein, partial [bacterium]
MKRVHALVLIVFSVPLCLCGLNCVLECPALAQAPNGTIAGVVTDPAGVHVAGARVRLTNRDSGLTRSLTTSTEGSYIAAALPPGVYRVMAEAAGFRSLQRLATVETGTTTAVNFMLEIGEVTEKVIVSDVAPLINYEQHQVSGLVNRTQIETLPLNGRNSLDLAKLEPGVTNPIHGGNNRIFVPLLGAGLQSLPRIGYTRVTVDGGDINLIGTPGAVLQVSQEAVQEFQISTVNFDLS